MMTAGQKRARRAHLAAVERLGAGKPELREEHLLTRAHVHARGEVQALGQREERQHDERESEVNAEVEVGRCRPPNPGVKRDWRAVPLLPL